MVQQAPLKLLIAAVLLFGCKPPAKTSEVKSLENFTNGTELIRINDCSAPPDAKIPHQALIDAIAIEPGNAKEAATVRRVLTAVPPGVLQFFHDSRGVIHLVPDGLGTCAERMTGNKGAAALVQRAVKYQPMKACNLQGMRNQETEDAQTDKQGFYEVLPPLDIYIQGDQQTIKHELVRQFAMTFFAHYGFLAPTVNKSKKAVFDPGVEQRPEISLAVERLIASYLMDVAKSPVFSLNMLDLYLGNGAGDILFKFLLGNPKSQFAPLERRYDTVLRASMGKKLDVKAMSRRVATFDTLMTIEAFDSYYCNNWGTFDKTAMGTVVDSKYETSADARRIIGAQQNSRRLMSALFPRTFAVFRKEIDPIISGMGLKRRKAFLKRARNSDSDGGLSLADGGNEEFESAKRWLSPSELARAKTADRSLALGWQVDDAYETRDRTLLYEQAVTLRYLQRQQESIEPILHQKLNRAEQLDSSQHLLQSALTGKNNLTTADQRRLFGSYTDNRLTTQPFDLLRPGKSEFAFPLQPKIESGATLNLRRAAEGFDGNQEALMTAMEALNGRNITSDQRILLERELEAQKSRWSATEREVIDLEAPLREQHKVLVAGTRSALTQNLPAYQEQFEQSLDASSKEKMEILKKAGMGHAAEGLVENSREQLLGEPIYNEKDVKHILDRDLSPDYRYDSKYLENLVDRRKSGIPLYLSTEVNYRETLELMDGRSKARFNSAVVGLGESNKEVYLANTKVRESVGDAIGGTEIPVIAQIGDAISTEAALESALTTGDRSDWMNAGASATGFIPLGSAVKQASKRATAAGETLFSTAGLANKRFLKDVSIGGGKTGLAVMGAYGANGVYNAVSAQPDMSQEQATQEARSAFSQQFGSAPEGNNANQIVMEAEIEATVRNAEDANKQATQEMSGTAVPEGAPE